jgi:3'-phosphoadenosine 5'-phosphosulfate sulfotransferase (PAPS reductase)/FAD synthetase
MPFPNEHSARLITPPKTFERVRRTKGGTALGKKIPASVSVIWYILKRDGKDVPVPQALRFPISNWTSERARQWLKDNNVKYILFEKASKGE